MATVRRYISDRTDGDGKAEIYLRFSGGRGRVYRLRSGLRILPSRWNTETETVVIPRLGTPEQRELLRLKARLDELCNLLVEKYTADFGASACDGAWLKKQIMLYHNPDLSVQKHDFFSVFDMYVSGCGLSEPRLRHLSVIRRKFQRFEMLTGRLPDVEAWTGEVVRKIEKFLFDEYKYAHSAGYRHIFDAVPESRTPGQRSRNTCMTSSSCGLFSAGAKNGILFLPARSMTSRWTLRCTAPRITLQSAKGNGLRESICRGILTLLSRGISSCSSVLSGAGWGTC